MSVNLNFSKTAERWQRYGEDYLSEARSYFLEINKTVLTVSTFLLGFIGIFIQIGDLKTATLLSKLLITGGFVFSVFSTIITLYVVVSMNCFLNKSGDDYQQLSENLANWMLKNNKSIGSKYPKEIYKGIKMKYQADIFLSKFQFPVLGLGFICIAVYFLTVIF